MDDASRGAEALTAKDFPTAISAYTKALIQHPTSPDYWAQRSTAFTRLQPPLGPNYTVALHDAEFAVLCGQERAKREKIQFGQQRRLVALFGLERYADAKLVLDSMKKYRSAENKPDKMEGDMWGVKVEKKLASLKEGDERGRVTIAEYPAEELPGPDAITEMLKDSLDTNGKYKFHEDEEDDVPVREIQRSAPERASVASLGTLTEISSAGPDESTESIPGIKVEREAIISNESLPQTLPTPPPSAVPTKIRHEWFQSHDKVTVTIYAKGVPKDKADIEIQPNSLSISFPHPADSISTFSLVFDPLQAAVDVSSSSFRVLSTKVEVVLAKQVPGHKWSSLEGTESPLNKGETAVTPTHNGSKSNTIPSYPTSSKSGPKNWDRVASDLSSKRNKESKEGEDDDSDFEGGDPVDGFFKKLYAGADEDTKRAMLKSYTESQGTSLSTNWSEVGKGKVEPVPPKED